MEKVLEKKEKKLGICSLGFIVSYMFYVIIISLIINLALERILEPVYILFKTKTVWDLEFWTSTGIITIIYILLNIVMVFASYKTAFKYWEISKKEVSKFLFIVGFIFPISLFLISYLTEGEIFPLILNTMSQMILTYALKKCILAKE